MNHEYRITWNTYAKAWKELSADDKLSALRESADPDCVYTDPNVLIHGHAELIDYMVEFHRRVPGGHFLTTWFLSHHDLAIARWDMVDASARKIGEGASFVRFDSHGRLASMTGFFEA